MSNKPLLSVWMITYNHEKYIASAIDSVLMQKTTFDYEIVIGEDCSIDGTRGIIEKYKLNYPNLIHHIYQEKNVGGMHNAYEFTLPQCRGKYIAILEGDDYWTDPLKLQKQVDFLEANEDFIICSTRAMQLDEKNQIAIGYDKNCTFERQDFLTNNRILTLTVVFRNVINNFNSCLYKCPIGDWALWVLLTEFGKVKHIPDITAVYRVHSNGIYSSKSHFSKKNMELTTQYYFNSLTRGKYNQLIIPYVFHGYKSLIWHNKKSCLNSKELISILKYFFISLILLLLLKIRAIKLVRK